LDAIATKGKLPLEKQVTITAKAMEEGSVLATSVKAINESQWRNFRDSHRTTMKAAVAEHKSALPEADKSDADEDSSSESASDREYNPGNPNHHLDAADAAIVDASTTANKPKQKTHKERAAAAAADETAELAVDKSMSAD